MIKYMNINRVGVCKVLVLAVPLMSACVSHVGLQNGTDSDYRAELAVVMDRSKSADFTKLRMGYTDTKMYSPYGNGSTKPIFNAINQKDFKKCLALSNELLKTRFPSLVGHYAAMLCNSELGQKESADFHKFVLDGLMDSIGNSGDGKSSETAFITISTDELYAFLQLAGLEVLRQALVNKNGQAYDVMTVKNPRDEKEMDLYFNISIQMSKGMKFLN